MGSSSPPSNRAPIRSSGAVTRRIGRFESEASPVSVTLSPVTPAQAPSSKRAAVPLLPQSIGSAGEVHGAPVTVHSPCAPRTTPAPSDATAAAVASTSSLSSSPRIRVVPLASAPRIKARCEQLLSPGMFASPRNDPPRCATSFMRAAPRPCATCSRAPAPAAARTRDRRRRSESGLRSCARPSASAAACKSRRAAL